MTKLSSFLALLIVLVNPSFAFGQSPEARIKIAGSIINNSIQVISRSEGGVSFGQAVLLNEIAITACHVIRNSSAVLLSKKGDPLRTTESWGDSYKDVCIYTVDQETEGGARLEEIILSEHEPLLGEEVFFGGASSKSKFRVSSGKVLEVISTDAGKILRISNPCYESDSGSGLFNKDGNLVGIISFFLIFDRGKECYAMSAEIIKSVIGGDRSKTKNGVAIFEQKDLPWGLESQVLIAKGEIRGVLTIAFNKASKDGFWGQYLEVLSKIGGP